MLRREILWLPYIVSWPCYDDVLSLKFLSCSKLLKFAFSFVIEYFDFIVFFTEARRNQNIKKNIIAL